MKLSESRPIKAQVRFCQNRHVPMGSLNFNKTAFLTNRPTSLPFAQGLNGLGWLAETISQDRTRNFHWCKDAIPDKYEG